MSPMKWTNHVFFHLCSYDFAFVDAEKKMYQDYFELLLQLVGSIISQAAYLDLCHSHIVITEVLIFCVL